MSTRRAGAMAECETRTQGAFVAGGYGRDRGRGIAPASAAGGPVDHPDSGSVGLTGILLAGGLSTRFGSPKELAEFEGETLGARAWRLLGEACEERIRVGPGGLEDPGTGPVAAVAAGLRAASHDFAVVIPVDMPRLTAEALRCLAAACRDAAVAQNGPLPCAVARRSLPAFETDERRLRTVLDGLRTASVRLPEAVLANVNDRDDLQRLE